MRILICFSLYRLFPARTPMVKTPEYWNLEHHVGNVSPGLARSALSQGAYQIAALGTTLAFAVFGGLFTGKIYRSDGLFGSFNYITIKYYFNI